jgi:TonB family protein
MSAWATALTGASFPFDGTSDAGAAERRLWIAIGISFVVHALAIAALRGFLPMGYTLAEAGTGSLPVLQALLAGPPPAKPEPEEPVPPQPATPPDLVVPAESKPIETTFGRAHPPAGGKPASAALGAPEINVSVGTLADPAPLGANYVEQLAQRFPNPAQKIPMLLGAPIVDYPRAAIERGLEGRFAAVVTLDALGKVTDAKLVVDDPLFGPAILDALKRMEFAPAQDGGSPIPYWTIVQFVFSIGTPEPRSSVAEAAVHNRGASPRRPGLTR